MLFADLKGSMELLADRDPEEARKLLDPVLERMMEAVHRYEGTVNQVMGDGIMALFGAPLGARGPRGAGLLRRAADAASGATATRTRSGGTAGCRCRSGSGSNSGEVVVRAIGSDLHMDYTAVGQTTHLAARMEQMAKPGSDPGHPARRSKLAEGYVEVKPLGAMPVKGLEAPIEVYELTGAGPVRSRLQAAAARGLTRFVGRDGELEQLAPGAGARRSGHGQVVAVVGEARGREVAARLGVHALAPHPRLARWSRAARSPTGRPRRICRSSTCSGLLPDRGRATTRARSARRWPASS